MGAPIAGVAANTWEFAECDWKSVRGARERPGGEAARVASYGGLPWLLAARVVVPERVPDYLDRAALVQRALPTRRRLTVLRAPGGFGKTTVLAECCRLLAADGVLAAWLSLDEEDDGELLDAYLAFAFERAGLDVLQALGADADAGPVPGTRAELVMRAVEAHEGPCVLALDEVERVVNPDALEVIDFLLRRGPPNLHVAMACRDVPAELDVAGVVVAGGGAVLSVDDLRFANGEVDDFFADRLRPEPAVLADAAGWPIALRLHRNGIDGGRGTASAVAAVESADRMVDNWVEAHLWRGLRPSDRRLLLDAGLCEWLDAQLLDEIVGEGGAMRRLADMPALDGLLERVAGVRERWRLHPLLRGHCVRRMRLRELDRFGELHRRIAAALARRGDALLAMRHAREAGDGALVGQILEDAGGIRLYLREGLLRLRAADRLLTDAAAARPRLALARCGLMAADGRLDEARPAFAAVAARVDGAADAPLDVRADCLFVAGMLVLYGCDQLDSGHVGEIMEDQRGLADAEGLDPVMRAGFHHGMCILHNMRAEFGAALEHAAVARRCLGDAATGLSMFIEMQFGTMAMAQGRVGEAASRYARMHGMAKAAYLRDPTAAVMARALVRELAHERNRLGQVDEAERVPGTLGRSGTPLVPYAAFAGTAVETALRREGAEAALAALAGMREYAARHELRALRRFLAALYISLRAETGAVDAAQRAWRDAGLPDDAEGCLDLSGQTWREMEALGCARLRLHIARAEHGPGRAFGRAFAAVARERGLRRTLMRGLALLVSLEHRAGAARAATSRMKEFLAEYAHADYAGPMVRERGAALPVLTRILGDPGNVGPESTAQALLRELEADVPTVAPRLTRRQRQVVRRLEQDSNKEIARALGISESGVRYHVGRLFDALGVRGRFAAVERARELGLLDAAAD